MLSAVFALVLVALPSTTARADEPGVYSPAAGDDYRHDFQTHQGAVTPDYQIDGIVYELGPPPIILPLVGHYNVGLKSYGWWRCYGSCDTSPSTYVESTWDTAVFFIDDVWWMGQRIGYTGSIEVTWSDNPQKAYRVPPDFVGPVDGYRAYQQGVTDVHTLNDPRYCDSWIYGPNQSLLCFSGGGINSYHHAPLFHDETSVLASDDTAYFGTGSGSYDWGWDGIE